MNSIAAFHLGAPHLPQLADVGFAIYRVPQVRLLLANLE